MSAKQTIRLIITIVAVVTTAAHLVFPSLKIDAITVSLIAMAIIPWLEPLFKSVGLPGGITFQFHDLDKITADAEEAGLIPGAKNITQESFTMTDNNFIELAKHNPELAPISLRIEIEKKLRKIAVAHSIDSKNYSAGQLIDLLQQKLVLSEDEGIVLRRLINNMSYPVRQSPHDPQLAAWVIENGIYVVNSLEKKMSH
jgi:hypothetical protein